MLKRLARSGAWAALDSFSAAFLAFGFFVVTARILGPEQFGVAMLALSIYQMLQPLIDSLFNDAIVQKETVDDRDVTTAATFCLGWSIFLALSLLLSAPSIAALLSVPALAVYLPPLGVGLICCGASAIVAALARREMDFRALAIRTIIARTASLILGTIMALLGFGVWAVVFQILSNAFLSALLLLSRSGVPLGRTHWSRLKPLLAFAGPTAGTQFLLFANTRIITLIIGGFLGPVAAGIWGVAFRFVEPIQVVLATSVGQTTLPLFSRKQSDRDSVARYFLFGSHVMAAIVVPIFVGLAYTAPDVIRIFVGEGWLAATPIMRIVCIGTALLLLRQVAEIALISIGRPRYAFYTHALGGALSLLGVLVGVMIGLIPAAFGWALRLVPFFTVNFGFVDKELALRNREQLGAILGPLLASLIMCAGLYWLEGGIDGEEPIARLAVLVPAGAIVYAIALLAIDGQARHVLINLARGKNPVG